MWSAELVLVCALSALGRAPSTLPPIQLVDRRPWGVSPTAEGFVRVGENRIYLLTDTPVFRSARKSDAKCGAFREVRKIASVIVHEEWHLLHPGDERGAYSAQLTMLQAMGIGNTHPVFMDVRRAMIKVLEEQQQSRRTLLAKR